MTYLTQILNTKQNEINALTEEVRGSHNHPIAQVLRDEMIIFPRYSFTRALLQNERNIIAECKRCSPSKGCIREQQDLFDFYLQCQFASAFSIHTDPHFNSDLEQLSVIAHHPKRPAKAILRKDFILTEEQIAQSVLAGSDAVLLIVAALGNRTKEMVTCAKRIGIDALVEVHNEAELEIALEAQAQCIAVNNRDLHTFKIYPERALELKSSMPQKILAVAASGIERATMAHEYFRAGYQAVLIGEALSRATSPDHFIRECMYEEITH